MRVVAIAGLVGLALTACGEPAPAGGALPPPSNLATVPSSVAPPTTAVTDVVGSNGPFDPDASMQPDLMVITPMVAAPGDELAVTFPGGRERGVAYVLEWSHDGTWHTTHYLTATTDGYGTTPSWVPFGSEGWGWEDIGIGGAGPDTLVVPEPARAGDYRICTANSVENICTAITIVDDGPTTTEPDRVLGEGFGDAAPVADFLGEPQSVFGELVGELGLGPVRVAWRNGEQLDLTADLVPGRVNVAVETRDGVEVVIDARVEADPETGSTLPEATVVDVFDGVEFYPACGNEPLEHEGVLWYQVQRFEYPEVYERAANGFREQAPETVEVRGFAPRVAEPGPGDDVGTLVVWSDGVAYFVSDSSDLHAWLVTDELTYDWVC